MKIVVTGGGSGGHITPILAVAHELKQINPAIEIIYIGQTGDGLGDIPAQDPNIDVLYTVRAGKLRRYHGEGLRQLLDVPTVLKNIRDMFYVVAGLWQSFRLLRKLRPDVLFIKGGFVGVPVGLSAAALRIPFATHDSDALPGLANRIVARWARIHAVGLPKEVYNYPQDKTVTVGVPLMHQYYPYTAQQVQDARRQVGIDPSGRVLFVTGGGLGAQRLNDAVADCVPELLQRYPDLTIVQLAGRAHEAALRQRYKKTLSPVQQQRVAVKGYVTNLHAYSGAADVIITRAGATSIAEFAAQQKACVVVPNPVLAGGHQLKNAQVLAERRAVRLVDEVKLRQDSRALMPAVTELFDNPRLAKDLGQKLGKLAQPDAAKRLAVLLLDIAA
ncbi:MAG TPA: UDP-N-acetylglucosamine--N-acetylmuramyl-(pentapeptide) pyrophosphoryl-undecaprenol N-acetylglucosamine transferase [Candidatus Saccharimonadales bacterium]|nr:UDP-N-acetylglucosamine--N-acetylmuramyl-(pentapeptide) pyrophosphoryl-undecaprenol N-acetylglucosamine transferase [Candidatus Saccharimonadales bacterium]